jgi:hypothetical protein
MLAEMPLVGRAEVLQRILDGLGVPGAAAFVLAGKAGVGKTRVAAEVRRAVLEQGRPAAHVVATKAAASIPFGAFAPSCRPLRRPRTSC